jgi:FkbM family methyltransferase
MSPSHPLDQPSRDRPALSRRVYRTLRLEKVRYLPWPTLWVPLLGCRGWLCLLGDLAARKPHAVIRIRPTGRLIRARRGSSDLRVALQVYGRGEVRPPVPVEAGSILDAGSNVGITVGALLDHFPNARILALEPDPENIAAFRQNILDDRVVLVEAGLWDADGSLNIANPGSASWARQVEASSESRPGTIAACTLDTLAARAGVERFDILKIDIEGAETRIFVEAFRHHFDRARMVFVEAHGPAAQRQIDAFLSSCGFTLGRQGDMTVGYRKG